LEEDIIVDDLLLLEVAIDAMFSIKTYSYEVIQISSIYLYI